MRCFASSASFGAVILALAAVPTLGCSESSSQAPESPAADAASDVAPEASPDAEPEASPGDAGADAQDAPSDTSVSDATPADAETDAAPADAAPDGPDPVCGPPIVVTDAKGLLAVIASLDYSLLGPYTSAHLPVSVEVHVQGSLTMTGAEIPLPPGCDEGQGCRQWTSFLLESPVDGVSPPADAGDGMTLFDELTFTDAVFRVRPILRDSHPGPYNYIPAVMILPGCAVPCLQDEARCPLDRVCYGEDEEYCRLCEALDKQICACWTQNGPQPDSTLCHFRVSGDVICGGTCVGGECQSSTPGGGCP